MVYEDPYSPERSHYECLRCGHRETTDSLESCPNCDGTVRNIAVPRE
ncbi:rubrerythrin-like domain-containing protein [Natrinema soli]|uniref:Rubrerythrin-like domain-containing protein n=1 Tax=Natrinema soli TaxID=1930624 RepID=A0ABD5SWK8_9EURY|nr:rubrerythrin-like domain-containing protein [Natrinema soli]